MQKTVLLTGAAGFIGSNLLHYLFNKYEDYRFIALDALTYAGRQSNFSPYLLESSRFEFWYGDVTNPYIVGDLMSRADLVVHLAAETHVARSIFDNSKFFHTDVIGTQTLMNALLKCKNVERFIHISTSEVYGTAESEPMDEDHPLNPRSPYAGAKAGADRLVYSYWAHLDLPCVIIRPFNNYGPRQHLEKVIPRFITSALMGKPLTVHGTGDAKRDWVYVQDHCKAIDKTLHIENFGKIKNQVINIGSGEAHSVYEIAKIILQEMGASEDLLTHIGERPGQVKLHIASAEKARRLLGWEPRTNLLEGLRHTIKWYRENENWWQDLLWMTQVPIRTAEGKIEMH